MSPEQSAGDRDVDGIVLTRRTVSVADGELRRVAAPQGTFVRQAGGWTELTLAAPKLDPAKLASRRVTDLMMAAGLL